jgi:hypothetical protein
VARIEPVARFDRAAALDPARRGGFNEAVPTLPSPQPVLAADVVRFRRAMADGVVPMGALQAANAQLLRAAPWFAPIADSMDLNAGAQQVGGVSWAHEPTPADRIVATLQHLRGLRGL